MTYKLNGKSILFEINRAEIIDISVGDVIAIEGFPGVEYVWTEQDGEFVENNPDDDIFLKIERIDAKNFKGTGILLK